MKDETTNKMERELSGAILHEKRRRKHRKVLSILLAWLLVLFIFVAIVVIIVVLIMAAGGRSLRGNAQGSSPNLVMDEVTPMEGEIIGSDGEAAASDTDVVWQEGWVRHDGKIYAYNEDILTFLVMGIDKNEEVTESSSLTDGGQSDALFLVIVDPHEKDIHILAINRDTMTAIQMVGMGPGGTTTTSYAQIAVQHGFGDGKELSCELTRDAVSALLYDLPIHGYVAVNMAAIPTINDAVGGVEVTVLEDLTKVSRDLEEGASVTLMGQEAYYYVKWRDTSIFESARGRLARQKQYLGAFAMKLKEATKKDISVPVKLYQELSKYMVTDITMDEVAYLAGELLNYNFTGDNVHTLKGETLMGERYEEFYPDEEALKELMLQLFYEEVEQ